MLILKVDLVNGTSDLSWCEPFDLIRCCVSSLSFFIKTMKNNDSRHFKSYLTPSVNMNKKDERLFDLLTYPRKVTCFQFPTSRRIFYVLKSLCHEFKQSCLKQMHLFLKDFYMPKSLGRLSFLTLYYVYALLDQGNI